VVHFGTWGHFQYMINFGTYAGQFRYMIGTWQDRYIVKIGTSVCFSLRLMASAVRLSSGFNVFNGRTPCSVGWTFSAIFMHRLIAQAPLRGVLVSKEGRTKISVSKYILRSERPASLSVSMGGKGMGPFRCIQEGKGALPYPCGESTNVHTKQGLPSWIGEY